MLTKFTTHISELVESIPGTQAVPCGAGNGRCKRESSHVLHRQKGRFTKHTGYCAEHARQYTARFGVEAVPANLSTFPQAVQ